MSFRRARFGDLIERQLALFVEDDGDLLEDVDAALARYDGADRDEAEELFGDYQLALEAAAERLAELRDAYGRTLAGADAERYEEEFNGAVSRRWPALTAAIEEA
ncbi:MAG: hypothetical protein ICV64_02220 [Thermoleophilia bacterium]|nr:hypothetical protein [Thermoleophilia bacterium]